MTIHSLRPLLAEHPFFAELDSAYLDLLVGCARNVRFDQDQPLFAEGDAAGDFFLVRHGLVAIEMLVGSRPMVVHSVGPGEVLGWSWLVPPHRWRFGARAVQLTRAVALDGACLRGKCEADAAMGYELLRRFAHDLEERLYQAWLQMLDVYG